MKKERKLSLFTDNMIVHVQSHEESFKNLLELISEFSKIAGYEVYLMKINCISIY